MSMYFAASGLAYVKGVDSFANVMPKERFDALYCACKETKGSRWVERNFMKWIVAVAGRQERAGRCPPAGKPCKYRMSYGGLDLQRNALRVEICSPMNRCGKKLKDGRIGGRPDDYHVCRVSGSCGVPL